MGKTVDLKKYLGKWHEVESFPAWFQKGCKNTTAEYSQKGGYIEVKNSCDKDGRRKVKVGKAFTTDKGNTLKVQFFWPFKADYKIEHVDPDYKNAVVGSGDKSYLWLLSRSESPSKDTVKRLRKIAADKGYDVSKLR